MHQPALLGLRLLWPLHIYMHVMQLLIPSISHPKKSKMAHSHQAVSA